MRIHKLVRSKTGKQYLKVILEGGKSFKLHEEVVAKYMLSDGAGISEERLDEIVAA